MRECVPAKFLKIKHLMPRKSKMKCTNTNRLTGSTTTAEPKHPICGAFANYVRRLIGYVRSCRWHKQNKYSTTSAWARWTCAIHFPPWGLGVIGESWGIRIILGKWHCCMDDPKWSEKVANTNPPKDVPKWF